MYIYIYVCFQIYIYIYIYIARRALGNFASRDIDIYSVRVFAQVRRLRKSPQYLLVMLQWKMSVEDYAQGNYLSSGRTPEDAHAFIAYLVRTVIVAIDRPIGFGDCVTNDA